MPPCRARFTIHGLWKNFDSGRWPSFCHHERFDADPLAPLREKLDALWPSYYGANEGFWVSTSTSLLLTAHLRQPSSASGSHMVSRTTCIWKWNLPSVKLRIVKILDAGGGTAPYASCLITHRR